MYEIQVWVTVDCYVPLAVGGYDQEVSHWVSTGTFLSEKDFAYALSWEPKMYYDPTLVRVLLNGEIIPTPAVKV